MLAVPKFKERKTVQAATSFACKFRCRKCSATPRICAAAHRDAPRSPCIFRITPRRRLRLPKRWSRRPPAKRPSKGFAAKGLERILRSGETDGQGEIRAQ